MKTVTKKKGVSKHAPHNSIKNSKKKPMIENYSLGASLSFLEMVAVGVEKR